MIAKVCTFLTVVMTLLSLILTSVQAYQNYLTAEEEAYSTEYIYDQ